MMYLGDYVSGATIDFKWSSNAADGSSITRATNGTIYVYKANGTTETTTGVTDTEDFDSRTGIHHVRIATTDAFYATGNDYAVVLAGATIDGKTVNAVLAHFSIENRNQRVDVRQWNGTAVATPATAGYPAVTVKSGTGTGEISLSSGQVTATVAARTVDGSIDELEALKVILAALAGKASGGGTTTLTFRNAADSANVLTMTVDSSGNRSAVTLSP